MNIKTGDSRAVVVKVGTSFIDHKQAERNRQREIGPLEFDEVRR